MLYVLIVISGTDLAMSHALGPCTPGATELFVGSAKGGIILQVPFAGAITLELGGAAVAEESRRLWLKDGSLCLRGLRIIHKFAVTDARRVIDAYIKLVPEQPARGRVRTRLANGRAHERSEQRKRADNFAVERMQRFNNFPPIGKAACVRIALAVERVRRRKNAPAAAHCGIAVGL